jgi:hypothetical protein
VSACTCVCDTCIRDDQFVRLCYILFPFDRYTRERAILSVTIGVAVSGEHSWTVMSIKYFVYYLCMCVRTRKATIYIRVGITHTHTHTLVPRVFFLPRSFLTLYVYIILSRRRRQIHILVYKYYFYKSSCIHIAHDYIYCLSVAHFTQRWLYASEPVHAGIQNPLKNK